MKDDANQTPPGAADSASGEAAAQRVSLHPLVRDHRRDFAANDYVYAVVSRRSKGLSVGVNLNPDKICNFDCVYCQVDRTTPGGDKNVDLPRLRAELEDMLDRIGSGDLFQNERFAARRRICAAERHRLLR